MFAPTTPGRRASVESNREIHGILELREKPPSEVKISVSGERRKDVNKWYLIKGIFDWYPSYLPPEEKKLLRKLDLGILVFCSIQFFLKYLDSSNITNAYNSGMSDDLNLHGNELNLFVVLYNVGYMTFQIPVLLMLSRPQWARWIFPTCELLWGLVTFTESKVNAPGQLYAIRFILGALESPSFSGTNFILGSWFTGDELYKRAGTWFVANALGSMFSGYLQTAAFETLNGVGGMAGWRWLFIIDGIITVPLAIFGFFMFPGMPQGKKPWYLTDEEHALAKARMDRQKIAAPKKITWATARRILSQWHWYLGVITYVLFLNETYPTGYMSLFLKRATNDDGSLKYTIPQVNNIPTGVQAVIAITSWLAGSLVGVVSIWPLMLFIQVVVLFAAISLRIWNIPIGLKFVAYMLLGFSSAPNPLIFGLINQMCRRDAEERAVVIGSMMMFGWAFFAWLPLLIFPTVEAPQWKKGYTVQIILIVLCTISFMTAMFWHRRDEKKEEALIHRAEEEYQIERADSMDFKGKDDIEHNERMNVAPN